MSIDRQHDCSVDGHSWDFIMVAISQVPAMIVCRYCDASGNVTDKGAVRSDIFWFADMRDEEERDARWPWSPFIQTGGCCLPLPIWFETEEACVEFIRTDILTALPKVEP